MKELIIRHIFTIFCIAFLGCIWSFTFSISALRQEVMELKKLHINEMNHDH